MFSVIVTGAIALGLTIFLEVTHPGICPMMGAAVAAWMGFSWEVTKAIP